jgi:DNA-binding GntR family transcriptional regulator
VPSDRRELVPAGRAGTTEEFASVAAFLCSDRASYVTGVEASRLEADALGSNSALVRSQVQCSLVASATALSVAECAIHYTRDHGWCQPAVPTTIFFVAPKADEIVDIVHDDIVSGKLPPGSILRQEHLAKTFRVSRTPVREALKRLHAAGLVSLIPHRGARVRLFSLDELQETFIVRAELEALAAELAAGRASPDQLVSLRGAERQYAQLSSQLAGAIDDESLLAEWATADHAFHDVVLESSGIRLLGELVRSVRGPFLGQILGDAKGELAELFEVSVRHHAAICELIEARSSAGARAVMREHIEWSAAVLELLARRADTSSPPTLLRRLTSDPFYLRGGEPA